MKIQGLTHEQHAKLGDFVVWDAKTNSPRAITRDDVGETMSQDGRRPGARRDGSRSSWRTATTVECATLWTLYQVHLKDYDLDTVAEITRAPKPN